MAVHYGRIQYQKENCPQMSILWRYWEFSENDQNLICWFSGQNQKTKIYQIQNNGIFNFQMTKTNVPRYILLVPTIRYKISTETTCINFKKLQIWLKMTQNLEFLKVQFSIQKCIFGKILVLYSNLPMYIVNWQQF